MSSTTEDYLKRILTETQTSKTPIVKLGRLAALSGVTPGTVTTMMKSLEGSGYVRYLPRKGVKLTKHGEDFALKILRRHRLIELFLVETLGLDWSEVHSEAEILEHVVSDRIVERMDEFLDHPSHDPHGDPIPTESGRLDKEVIYPLSDVDSGGIYRVSRVDHAEDRFLNYLDRIGMRPGQNVSVGERDLDAGTIGIHVQEKSVVMSLSAATKVFVEPA